MLACEALLERGFYAQGIRHPSVPAGTARLRITLMASHTEADVDALAEALVAVVPALQERSRSAAVEANSAGGSLARADGVPDPASSHAGLSPERSSSSNANAVANRADTVAGG